MNRGQIRSAVAEALRSTGFVRWTSVELDEYIDDGYRMIANRTGCVAATTTLTTTPNNHYIDLPRETLYPIAFRDLGTGLPIDPVHWSFIDRNPFWARKTSTRAEIVAAWGLKRLLLDAAYTVVASIEMMHTVSPITGLGSDGAVPSFPQQFHVALVDYAHFRALLKDADQMRLGRALRQYGYCEDKITDLEEWAINRNEGVAQAMYGERFRTAGLPGGV
jgi:hypothetical protein